VIFHIANGYMPIRKWTISASVLLAVSSAGAQSVHNKHISWWPAYYLRYSINKKWVVNTDLQARNFAKQPTVGLLAVRTGAHYYFNNHWSTAIGGAWFHQRQESGAGKKIVSDEVRLWEELKHEWKLKKWQLINQFRTEQRHWTNQQGLAFRFRYRLAADLSIGQKWKALAGNELMWQTSKTRQNWDQYRAWVGGEYAVNAKKQVQLVLMNWWQFNNDTQQPVVRINFVQSINAAL
jgi:Protein of unknown function (DUF2490)